MTDRRPDTITGPASTERCCPIACDYRPEAVQVYLSIVLDMEQAGEDPCQKSAGGARYGRSPGSAAGDGPTRLWDVQQAVKALRRAGTPITAVAVSAKLCPWALDEAGH